MARKKMRANSPDEIPFFGRDPSWIAFNERVVSLAEDPATPLFERLRFLSISGSNLDEFFMKRVARMKRRLEMGVEFLSHDGMTVREQSADARRRVMALQERQAQCWEDQLIPALADQGIEITAYRDLSRSRRAALDSWFQANVYPILTPLAVDQGQRFPFISNLSKNIGVLVSQPRDRVRLFARLKIPPSLPSFVPVTERKPRVAAGLGRRRLRFVPLLDVIEANLGLVFPGMRVAELSRFRITRRTGVELEEEEGSGDILESVEAFVQRRRFAEPVRLEVRPGASEKIVELLRDELELEPGDVYERPGILDYSDLKSLLKIEAPELEYPAWRPVVPPRLATRERDLFAVIRERDLFVHHPYESFHHSVENFIATAARDPNVLAIKQTVYRTTEDSPFIQSLIHAAQEGKQVACLVELRARFDEDRNLQLVRRLERHGVHVTYGVIGLKTHCKLALVVRREGDQLQSYVHIGTGNYHSVTANLYTDCGLFTCDPDITEDATHVFNFLTGRSLHHHYERLLVAPVTMRDRFLALIDHEIAAVRRGRPARILAKMNQLEDRSIITKLYEASQAGVPITLLIRGFCCLRPGVPGLSENIRVISVLGRFLEHSRIFHFAAGEADPVDGEWYIGSADWMRRNLDGRVETMTPVNDQEARRRLVRIIEASMRDRRQAWDLLADGRYERRRPAPNDDPHEPEMLGTFETLCRDALAGIAPREASDFFLRSEARGRDGHGVPDSLETETRRFLRMFASRPWLTAKELCAAAGLREKRLAAVRKELVRLNLAVPCSVGRTALLEPTGETFARVEGQPERIAGRLPFARRWLAARILADLPKSESAEAQREVEAGLTTADLMVGKKEAKRRAWMIFDDPETAAAELAQFVVLPARQRTVVALDAATHRALRKAVAALPAETRAHITVRTFSQMVDATRSTKAAPKKQRRDSDRKRRAGDS
ncbi:MAG: polyphosphate kinase 1 [Planctomycetota bacterium]